MTDQGLATSAVRIATLGLVSLSVGLVLDPNASAHSCALITKQEQVEAASFIQRQFGFSQSLVIYEASAVPGTCYTRLHLRLIPTNEDIRQDFYLSPDHRFITLDLFDMELLGPRAELEARTKLRTELDNNYVPALGKRRGSVLVSLFADLECPYCREEVTLLTRDVIPLYGDRVTIAFHHLPLERHKWSKAASEVLSCIQRQAPEAFWPVAEWVMENQAQFSVTDITPKILSKVDAFPKVHRTELSECVEDHLGAGMVEHDESLAKDLSVTSTPTTFVEGHRLIGAMSASTLKRAINGELERVIPKGGQDY